MSNIGAQSDQRSSQAEDSDDSIDSDGSDFVPGDLEEDCQNHFAEEFYSCPTCCSCDEVDEDGYKKMRIKLVPREHLMMIKCDDGFQLVVRDTLIKCSPKLTELFNTLNESRTVRVSGAHMETIMFVSEYCSLLNKYQQVKESLNKIRNKDGLLDLMKSLELSSIGTELDTMLSDK